MSRSFFENRILCYICVIFDALAETRSGFVLIGKTKMKKRGVFIAA